MKKVLGLLLVLFSVTACGEDLKIDGTSKEAYQRSLANIFASMDKKDHNIVLEYVDEAFVNFLKSRNSIKVLTINGGNNLVNDIYFHEFVPTLHEVSINDITDANIKRISGK